MAAQWNFPRSVTGTRILTEVGRDYGLSLGQCLQGTNLPAGCSLDDSNCLVEAGEELQVIRNLQRHLGADVPLAYEAGRRSHATTFGVWGFALLSSDTVRKAMEVALRYQRLSGIYCGVELKKTAMEITVIARDEELPDDVRSFLVERDAVTMLTIQRDILPVNPPLNRIDLVSPRPAYHRLYEDFFGIAPRYRQSKNCAVAPLSFADVCLPQWDQSTHRVCKSNCEELLQRREVTHTYSDRIRSLLVSNLAKISTMDDAAAGFKMTARTLRRHLAREGSDYASLVAEQRRVNAEKLLKTTSLPIDEISTRVGYAEPACFIRAFKRWNGVTPTRFRKESVLLR